MNDVNLFLENMFEYFRDITKNGRYEGFKFLSYDKDYSFRFASFLDEMDYCSYDVKNTVIKMSTKTGEVYSFDELLNFNEKNSDYLKITGVGNDISSVTIDPGCAIIEFTLNKDYYGEDILDIQKAVKLIDLTDNFDVFPIEIIEERCMDVIKKFGLSKIVLVGDYAKGIATEESTLDFIINYDDLHPLEYFGVHGHIEDKFKCNVNVFKESEFNICDSEMIIFSAVN